MVEWSFGRRHTCSIGVDQLEKGKFHTLSNATISFGYQITFFSLFVVSWGGCMYEPSRFSFP